jgi:hypothetical protein
MFGRCTYRRKSPTSDRRHVRELQLVLGRVQHLADPAIREEQKRSLGAGLCELVEDRLRPCFQVRSI